eukprot:6484185-Amphidinium_carterae.1
MSEHARQWEALGQAQQARYEALAEVRRNDMAKEIVDELEHERAALSQQRSQHVEVPESGATMSACRLSAEALASAEALWNDHKLTLKQLSALRLIATSTPEPLAPDYLQEVVNGTILTTHRRTASSTWIRELCRRREGACTSVILRRMGCTTWTCSRVVLLSKNPQVATFLPLTHVVPDWPHLREGSIKAWRTWAADAPEILFSYEQFEFSDGSEFED